MRKWLSILLACIMVLGLIGSATAADGKDLSGKKIVFAGWGDAAEQEATQNIIDRFTADTGCEVEYIHIPSEYDAKITAMIAAGEQLDLAHMESGSIGYPLAAEGKFADLMPFVEADPDISMDDAVASGHYYSNNGELLTYGGNIEVMTGFYNPSLFDEAGIEYPNPDPAQSFNWDEFVAMAKKLTKDANGLTPDDEGFDPENIVQYGVSFDTWWPFWGSLILSNGGEIVDKNGNFAMNQPKAVEAIQKLADLALVHHVMPTPTAKQGLPGADVAMLTGQYAMVFAGQWTALSIDSAGAVFHMAPMPRMGEKTVTVCTAGMCVVMEDSTEKEAAWELIKYMNNPVYDITLFKNGNRMPTLIDWLDNPEKLALWAGEGNSARPYGYDGTIKMLKEYSVPPLTATIIGFSDVLSVVNPELDFVFNGEATAQEAMDIAAEKITQAGFTLGVRGQ